MGLFRHLRGTKAALGWLVGICLLDIALGDTEQTYLAPLLIACPALAAGTASPVGVAVVGALVLAARQLLAFYDNAITETSDARIFYTRTIGYVAVIGVSIYLAWQRSRHDRKLASVTSVALTAQHTILRELPTDTDLQIGLRYVSAADEALVGGDLYEVVTTQYGTRIVIGDVKGNGLDAVYAASIVLGAFRAVAYDEPDLAQVAAKIESTVYRHLGGDDFITALFVQVGPGQLSIVHRGHVPALLVAPDGAVRALDAATAGPPLGLSHLVSTRVAPFTAVFGPRDTLVLYTDGVIEARGSDGFYPLAERIADLLDEDLDASAGRLHADLLRHTGRALTDDAVVMLVRRRPAE